MTPSRSRILLIATAMVWLAAYAAWTADWIIEPMPYLLERSLRRIPTCLFGIALCFAIAGALRRLPAMRAASKVAIGIFLCIIAALVFAFVCNVAFYLIAPLWGSTTFAMTLASALTDSWVFLAWLALYFAIEADADARDSRVALAEARTAEQRARNQALAQQINPHFLFNTLNAVS
ncbi:MAG: histidine kinase, partial [Pseudomonadota bacterium]|nr:histidine kinase [Pseudomonadota bacterium]